jgi:Protein of unknown function (DUF1579)
MKQFICTVIAVSVLQVLYAQAPADSAFYQTKQSLWLSKKVGMWTVTMTLQPSVDAKPMTVTGMRAERTLIGAFCLHEIMQPINSASMPPFQRLADLVYNYNDARWDYMSIDTRITAGIMYFTNNPDTGDSIVSYILNTVHPGFGPKQIDRGKSMRVKNVIVTISPTHDIVRQYWKLTDGKEWLAVQYDYIRKG